MRRSEADRVSGTEVGKVSNQMESWSACTGVKASSELGAFE
jgi:hypothetical protein